MTLSRLLHLLALAPGEEQVARVLIGSPWPGAEDFSGGHLIWMRKEMTKRRKR